VRTIRDKGVQALFGEAVYPERIAGVIVREAAIAIRLLDPVATGSTSPTSYEDVMRANLQVLTEVLSGP
jgi:ABC-type Zn uptake system ZnuABC Zn-binding protein ZnuA